MSTSHPASNLTVRRATPADVDSLREIAQTTFVQTFGPDNTQEDMDEYINTKLTRERLLGELSNPHSVFWLCFREDKLIGYAKVNFGDAQSEFRNHDEAEVERIYVDNNFGRQGIGKKLLDVALEEIRKADKKQVWLGVWEKNYSAVAFYKKNGFDRVGEHIFKLGNDEQTDWIMRRSV
ncbi:hypothetical protein HK104_000701 [Borealophlyctis nickersoniae]|nr:hypothetical protein HK104_000701 [Borealophlyctis nickersoniae]